MPGNSTNYLSFDKAENNENNLFQPEYLNTIKPLGFPPHKLTLKFGCPIIMLRNLDKSRSLCNGTRLIITHLRRNFIQARITTGDHKGKDVVIPRIPLTAEPETSQLGFKFI